MRIRFDGILQSRRADLAWVATFLSLFLTTAALWFWSVYGAYGVNVLLRRGGSYWIAMDAGDLRLSSAMREALRTPPPKAIPGIVSWQTLDAGFEAGELPVLVNGQELDRVLLARIDPSRYSFTVRNRPAGDRDIDQWEAALPRSIMIVNASYFGLNGVADTPILSDSQPGGPRSYDAHAGAFVARDGQSHIVDLRTGSWQRAFAGASNALVSYPLLIGDDGATHVPTRSRWLANRTFVGEDRDGRIIIGTTRDAFFSLDRLADFLVASPLDLKLALNLDGGPVACQSIRFGRFHRKLYANWEAQVSGDSVSLLTKPWGRWAMPMLLSVDRR